MILAIVDSLIFQQVTHLVVSHVTALRTVPISVDQFVIQSLPSVIVSHRQWGCAVTAAGQDFTQHLLDVQNADATLLDLSAMNATPRVENAHVMKELVVYTVMSALKDSSTSLGMILCVFIASNFHNSPTAVSLAIVAVLEHWQGSSVMPLLECATARCSSQKSPVIAVRVDTSSWINPTLLDALQVCTHVRFKAYYNIMPFSSS